MRRFAIILACGLLSTACKNDSFIDASTPSRGSTPNVTGVGQGHDGREHSAGGTNGVTSEISGTTPGNGSGTVPNPSGRDNNGTSGTAGTTTPSR